MARYSDLGVNHVMLYGPRTIVLLLLLCRCSYLPVFYDPVIPQFTVFRADINLRQSQLEVERRLFGYFKGYDDYGKSFHISGRKVTHCFSETTAPVFSFYIASRYQGELHNYRNRTTCMHRNGTHATLFLWWKWLAVWITGACAQRRRTTTSHNMAVIQVIPRRWVKQSWITAIIFDIRHAYYV